MRRSVSTSGTTQILSKLERVLTYQNGVIFDIAPLSAITGERDQHPVLSRRWFVGALRRGGLVDEDQRDHLLVRGLTRSRWPPPSAVSLTWFLMVWSLTPAIGLGVLACGSSARARPRRPSRLGVQGLQSNESTFWVSVVAACSPLARAWAEVIAPFGLPSSGVVAAPPGEARPRPPAPGRAPAARSSAREAAQQRDRSATAAQRRARRGGGGGSSRSSPASVRGGGGRLRPRGRAQARRLGGPDGASDRRSGVRSLRSLWQ